VNCKLAWQVAKINHLKEQIREDKSIEVGWNRITSPYFCGLASRNGRIS